jgi:sugar phosphate isomerase/epimerase
MKFSISMTPGKPKFAPLVFTGGISTPLPLIAELGYDAIELHIGDPDAIDRAALRKALDAHRLSVSAIGTGLAFGEDGLSWADSDPGVRHNAVERVTGFVDLASEYGAALSIGLIRGHLQLGRPELAERQKRWILEACRECAGHADGTGAILAIEPINRYETNYIHTVPEAIDFVKAVDAPSVGILADTFHMNIEDVSITESIDCAGKLLSHVQLSDSNRRAPGFGHLDVPGVISALREVGYDRYLSFEVLPLPSPAEAAAQAIAYCQRCL